MSKIIIHNRSKKLSDAEACYFASRFIDLYGVRVKKLWLSIFNKKVFISTGKNEQSDRIIIEDTRQEELNLPYSDKRHKFGFDKLQTEVELK